MIKQVSETCEAHEALAREVSSVQPTDGAALYLIEVLRWRNTEHLQDDG
jgi:hypothetical protein